MRVDYVLPGMFEWAPYGSTWLRWVMPTGSGKRAFRPPVREQTREAALAASRPLLARIRAASGPDAEPEPIVPDVAGPREGRIVGTWLTLEIVYLPGASHLHPIRVVSDADSSWSTGTPLNVRRE